MWKIAVFDPDPPFAQRLAARIGALFSQENSALSCAVECFASLSALCARAKEFDLAFLAEPQASAPAVRRVAQELLWTRPLGCVAAPHDDAQLLSVLKTFWQYHGQDATFFIVETRRQLLHIRHEEILYFESRGKSVYPHTLSGAAESFPARLDVVAARLAPYRYVRCHQSYLANLRHVRQLKKVTHQLTLSSGATIPISKQYYAQVIECLRADRA